VSPRSRGSSKAKTKPKVEVEEIDEDDEDEALDELDDLEDLADEASEDAEDDEEEEDEDDEDEAPRRRKGKKKTTAKKAEPDTVGTADLAEALGTDGKNLRVMLRDKKANRPRSKGGSFNESGRYEWDSIDDALEALGFDSIEDAQASLKESRDKRLDALKDAGEKKRADKKKAKAAEEEDEEDEDEEDEDEDEEEETPPPRKRSSKSRATSKRRRK
jgi:hypothetical protein